MVPQLLANALLAAALYLLVALGFGLVYATARFFHFAHGAVVTIGAYLGYLLVVWCRLPVVVAAPLAVAGCALIGAVMEQALYRPLRARRASPLVLMLASLGLYIVLQNLVSLLFGDDRKGLLPAGAVSSFEVFGARVTTPQVALMVTSGLLWLALVLFLRHTRLGMAMRAVSENPELAALSGVSLTRVLTVATAIASVLAGAAGFLQGLDVSMTPTLGMRALMMGVVVVLVGGAGSPLGALLASLLLALAQQLSVLVISSRWQDAIAFVVLLLFLLLRPRGIVTRQRQAVEL